MLTICLAFLTQATQAETPSVNSIAEEAIGKYESGLETSDTTARREHFHRSQLLFSKAIEVAKGQGGRGVSANLYVNFGNAALQSQNFGQAIAAYRHAIALDRQNEQARQNLAYVRGRLPEWVRYDDETDLYQSFFIWTRAVKRSSVALWAAILFLLAVSVWACSIKFRMPALKTLAFVPIAGWVILLISYFVMPTENAVAAAVVIVDEISARSADSPGAGIRFKSPLPNGTEVTILQERDEWTQVEITDGQTCWLPDSALERVP